MSLKEYFLNIHIYIYIYIYIYKLLIIVDNFTLNYIVTN